MTIATPSLYYIYCRVLTSQFYGSRSKREATRVSLHLSKLDKLQLCVPSSYGVFIVICWAVWSWSGQVFGTRVHTRACSNQMSIIRMRLTICCLASGFRIKPRLTVQTDTDTYKCGCNIVMRGHEHAGNTLSWSVWHNNKHFKFLLTVTQT